MELGVQGAHARADGDDRLLLLADTLIEQHRVVERVELQRRGLLHLVDFGPRLTRLQPMDGMFHVALEEVQRLLGGGEAFIAAENSGLFVFEGSSDGIVVRAGTGRFAGLQRMDELDSAAQAAVTRALTSDLALVLEAGFVLIPMRTREGERGCIVIEGPLSADAGDLCRIYGQQVGQALENLSLWDRATTDALTRLHNRAFGAQRLEEIRSLDMRQNRSTGVLMIDIDRFKLVNDTFGHPAGDAALRAVARALHEVGRRSDAIARWGGEELLMVLPDTTMAQALLAGERVRRAVEALRVATGESVIRTTVSVGATSATPDDRRHADTLVADADRALYLAKNTGRNRVCGWPSEPYGTPWLGAPLAGSALAPASIHSARASKALERSGNVRDIAQAWTCGSIVFASVQNAYETDTPPGIGERSHPPWPCSTNSASSGHFCRTGCQVFGSSTHQQFSTFFASASSQWIATTACRWMRTMPASRLMSVAW